MAEEIVIGKLVIDNSELNNAMLSSKKAIIDLENEQKKLKTSTDGLSSANEEQLQTFIANENELKKLKSEYAANQKSVLDLTKAQTGLDAALAKTVKTEKEATANNAALKTARQQLDASTVEGAKAIADINVKMNANNAVLDANKNKQEQAATISGNYRQAIFGVGNAFGGATQQAIGFVQKGKDIVGALGEVNSMVVNSARGIVGFNNASKMAAVQAATFAGSEVAVGAGAEVAAVGTQAATKSTLALNLAIGTLLLPITAIVVTLGLVVAVFRTFQPLVDKVEQGVAALTATFNVIKNTILAVVSGAKSLKEAFSGLGGSMSDAAKEAMSLTKAQQDLDDVMKAQEVTTARNRAEINKLNVALKNRTLSEQERLKISDQIIEKENADFQQRKKIVDEEVLIARRAIALKAQFTEKEKKLLKETGDATKELAESRGGNYDAEFEALNKARLKAIALEDENTVNLEKQYVKRDKLEDDATAKREAANSKRQAADDKALQARLKNAQNEIDILKAQSEASNLSTEQRITNAEKIFALENKLAEQSLKGSDLQKQLIANRQELSSTVLSLIDEQIQKEADTQKAAFEKQKELTAEQFAAEVQSANDLALAQTLLLDKKLLSERAYADEVVKINALKNESLTIAQTTFDEAEKVRRESAAANQKILDDLSFQIKLQDITDRDAAEQEIKRALLQANYDNDLVMLQDQLAKESAAYGLSKEEQAQIDEKYRKGKELTDKKYAAATKAIDKEVAKTKRAAVTGIAADAIAAAESIFGESKALAVASALINTYQGITAVWAAPSSLPEPYATAAKVASTIVTATSGFAAVKNILKTDKSSTSIDSSATSTAKQATTSGAGAFVNTAQTETIARATDRPVDQNTVVTPPVLILETLQEKQNQLEIKIKSN